MASLNSLKQSFTSSTTSSLISQFGSRNSLLSSGVSGGSVTKVLEQDSLASTSNEAGKEKDASLLVSLR